MNGHDFTRRENDSEIEWVTVATAPDQLTAEMWKEYLRDNSIPSMLAAQDAVSFLGISPNPVRLMVPQETKKVAKELLDTIIHGTPATELDEPTR